MKKLILFLIFSIVVNINNSKAQQMLNYGAVTTITPNVYVCVEGKLINNAGGIINNNGTILLSGDYVNNSNFISGNNSYVKLTGAAQDVGGSTFTTFENLVIDGTADKTISNKTNINDSLKFIANHVKIAGNNLVLFQNAVHSGTSNSKFVVTNGTGSLVKKAVASNTDFLFPVGDAITSYKPVILNNSGTVDTFAVRVASGLLPTTGADPTCVQFTYFVEESIPGGSNASLSLGWNTADEGGSFVRAQTYMWQHINSSWSMLPGTPGAIANLPATNWYYKTSGITDFSPGANRFVLRTYQPLTILSQDTAQSTCENNTVTFSVTASGSNIQYQWQVNCGSGWTTLSDNMTYTGTQSTIITIHNPGLGMSGCRYQCIVNDLMDTITSQPATLTVHALPHAFAGNDTTIFVGNSLQLNASGGVSYQWNPSTYLNNSNISNPTSSPLNNISYIVTAIDEFGCADADTINIIIDESTDIFIPNAFAPEGNPINQILYVRGKGIKNLEFVVYDRWGEKVFESDNITHGWDGNFKGAKLSTAVFIYYVKATYYNGNEIERKGDVTLIR